MSEWAKKWRETTKQVRCVLCDVEDEAHKFLKCSQCDAYYHRHCFDPVRVDWSSGVEAFKCHDCSEYCVVCETDNDSDEENPLIICGNCDLWVHYLCMEDEDDRPYPEEIGDETKEWYCPDCMEEYGSDAEWGEEHEVAEADMVADECFTRSKCECDFCQECNDAVDTWKDFVPANAREARVKEAIDTRGHLLMTVMEEVHMRHGKPPPVG